MASPLRNPLSFFWSIETPYLCSHYNKPKTVFGLDPPQQKISMREWLSLGLDGLWTCKVKTFFWLNLWALLQFFSETKFLVDLSFKRKDLFSVFLIRNAKSYYTVYKTQKMEVSTLSLHVFCQITVLLSLPHEHFLGFIYFSLLIFSCSVFQSPWVLFSDLCYTLYLILLEFMWLGWNFQNLQKSLSKSWVSLKSSRIAIIVSWIPCRVEGLISHFAFHQYFHLHSHVARLDNSLMYRPISFIAFISFSIPQ